jgi:hypothetical protein
MLQILIPQFRRRRGRGRGRKPQSTPAPPPPPPAPLILQSASYSPDGGPGGEAMLTLSFDRAIDISAFDGAAVGAKDGIVNNIQYAGIIASLLGPSTVGITLQWASPYFESEQTMSAAPTTGIVAVDDGGTWEGVTDLPLPFP